jgi:hypothetical protein
LSEKYLKRLIGKTEIEDALKMLDKLTNEEARMVTAQVLNATHTVDDRVVRVDDRVARVDKRVAGVQGRSFPLTLVCNLKHPHREPITSGPSQVALSAGSVYQPQHCLWFLSQENI